MQKINLSILAFVLLAFLVSSCLTVEKKEYTFELTGKNSGILTIKYINIMSIKDDTTDVSEADFEELINTYYKGDQLEKDYPDVVNIEKRLYEENGVLCGEVTIEFTDLVTARLYQLNKKDPIMFSVQSTYDSETFLESNGEYGGEIMPVVFWPPKEKFLRLITSVMQPDETMISLVEEYREWKDQ